MERLHSAACYTPPPLHLLARLSNVAWKSAPDMARVQRAKPNHNAAQTDGGSTGGGMGVEEGCVIVSASASAHLSAGLGESCIQICEYVDI